MPRNGRILVICPVNGGRIPVAAGAARARTSAVARLARDLDPCGITVNAVRPGPVDADLNPADGPTRDLMHANLALKRHGDPEEIAALVAFLAGQKAGCITGALHTIDGGFGPGASSPGRGPPRREAAPPRGAGASSPRSAPPPP